MHAAKDLEPAHCVTVRVALSQVRGVEEQLPVTDRWSYWTA